MLICRESLLCGGRATEEEPRSWHLTYPWIQKELEDAQRRTTPETHDLAGDDSCVSRGHSPV